MKIAIIIPSRYKSTRFPGKPLKKINNKELILWVYDIAKKTLGSTNCYVATDSLKIKKFLNKKEINVIMTSKKCMTGTDRVAEASKKLNYDIFINLQGDEPLVSPDDVKKIIKKKIANFNKVICGYSYLSQNEYPENKNIPKVLFNKKKDLIYISRLPIPGIKSLKKNINITYYKQVCIYAFNKEELRKFSAFKKKTSFESHEDIELLRFFELNIKIQMVQMSKASLAVDEKKDIKIVENYINGKIY
jgi:3-deoxy-manno-octulosonate cytidylyltransferase (CMP-KDO synthetase)